MIAALELPGERWRGTIRLSLGRQTTEAEVDRVADLLAELVPETRLAAAAS